MAIATADHMPWRTVRRTSRTEWRLRPSSIAVSGAVAVTSPIPKIRKAKLRLAPERAGGKCVGTEPAHHDHVGGRQPHLREIGEDDGRGEAERGTGFRAPRLTGGRFDLGNVDHRPTF